MAAAPIYAALRDCKYEPVRARTSPLAHVYARAVRASCLLRTHERDGDTAQWRNNRVNGRTDAAMRKNLAGIRSSGINVRATAPTKAREPRLRREQIERMIHGSRRKAEARRSGTSTGRNAAGTRIDTPRREGQNLARANPANYDAS